LLIDRAQPNHGFRDQRPLLLGLRARGTVVSGRSPVFDPDVERPSPTRSDPPRIGTKSAAYSRQTSTRHQRKCCRKVVTTAITRFLVSPIRPRRPRLGQPTGGSGVCAGYRAQLSKQVWPRESCCLLRIYRNRAFMGTRNIKSRAHATYPIGPS